MQVDWAAVLDAARLVIAGFCGGLIRSIYFSELFPGYIRNCVIGMVASYYLGPLAPKLFEPWFPSGELGQFHELSGFLVGCGGVAVIGWINDYFEAKRKSHDDGGPSR